jgi:hypothetical protein
MIERFKLFIKKLFCRHDDFYVDNQIKILKCKNCEKVSWYEIKNLYVD